MFGIPSLPSWTIFGMHFNDRYYVWATDQLLEIEIQQGLQANPWSCVPYGETRVVMSIRGYTVAEGADWQEALRNLFGASGWDPDRQQKRREIEGQRAIESPQEAIVMGRVEFDPDTGRSPLDDWLKD